MSLLDMGLSLEGLDQETIAKLDAQLPAFQRLAIAVKEVQPQIDAMLPHIRATLPVIQKVWPDMAAVAPLAAELFAFFNNKEKQA